MHRKNFAALLAFVVIVMLASCAKEGPEGPTGASGPSYTGTINGHVSLYDKYGSPVLMDLNYFSLAISGGAPATPPPAPTTIYPDITGYYYYSNIATGNYTITVTDTSSTILFAATQINNIDFIEGTLTQDIKLSAVPDTFVVGFSSSKCVASLNDSLVIQATPDTRLRNCIVFVDSSATETGYLLRYIVPIPAGSTTVTLLVPQQDLLNTGMVSGRTARFAAFSYVVNDASVYENTITGQYVYNAITGALVDSAIVP